MHVSHLFYAEHPTSRYCAALKGMTLGEDGVARVVERRITSVALHPSTSSLLAATGDSTGQLGLWNPVGCLHF
ncbi:unnamed protein product [Lota lota]